MVCIAHHAKKLKDKTKNKGTQTQTKAKPTTKRKRTTRKIAVWTQAKETR
jgi:hypothetical protein